MPKAQRLIPAGNRVTGVQRRTSSLLVEEPDRPDGAVGTQIKPVLRARRHIDEIPLFDLDGKHRVPIFRIDVKDAVPFHNEAHLILRMAVLLVKLVQHLLQIVQIRSHVHHIRRDLAAALLPGFHLPEQPVGTRILGAVRVFKEEPF